MKPFIRPVGETEVLMGVDHEIDDGDYKPDVLQHVTLKDMFELQNNYGVRIKPHVYNAMHEHDHFCALLYFKSEAHALEVWEDWFLPKLTALQMSGSISV